MIKKIVKTGSCNCSGGTKLSIVFPIGVTKEFIESCKQAGFIDQEQYTNAGLLYIRNKAITISGALCLKNASVFCSSPNAKQCEQEIEETLTLLEKILNN